MGLPTTHPLSVRCMSSVGVMTRKGPKDVAIRGKDYTPTTRADVWEEASGLDRWMSSLQNGE